MGYKRHIAALFSYFLITILALSLSCISGCSTPDPPVETSAQPSLAATSWRVIEMIDTNSGSEIAREVNEDLTMEFQLNSDGTVTGNTPLNQLSGHWRAEGSSLTISLDDREIHEADDEQLELLINDFSMGSALVDADRFLLEDDGRILMLFDSTGRMVMRCEAIR